MRAFAVAPVLAAAIFASSCAAATHTVVLQDANLIDGTGAPERQHVSLVVVDGKITAITDVQRSTPLPAGATVIDCTGKTIMPGIIDAHAHLGILLGNATPSPNAYTRSNVVAALDQFERYGVTTIVSLGLNRDLVYDLRSEQEAGSLRGATIFTAGRGIGVPGGAPPLDVAPDQVFRPATVAEARADVDDLARRNADLVKVWVDDLHGKVPKMDPAIYAAVIDEAHKKHLKVAAHEYALADAKQLVHDGIDILAHSIRDQPLTPANDADLLAAMKAHGTWYIPTMTVDQSFFLYADHPPLLSEPFFVAAAGPSLLTRFDAENYSENVDNDPATAQHQQDYRNDATNLLVMTHSGINVGFGTDAGAMPGRIPGFSEHKELEDLVAAGLTPLQAITLATGRNGALLGTLNGRSAALGGLGILAPGHPADLVILNADPLANIRNTRLINAVYHRGRLVGNPPPTE